MRFPKLPADVGKSRRRSGSSSRLGVRNVLEEGGVAKATRHVD